MLGDWRVDDSAPMLEPLELLQMDDFHFLNIVYGSGERIFARNPPDTSFSLSLSENGSFELSEITLPFPGVIALEDAMAIHVGDFWCFYVNDDGTATTWTMITFDEGERVQLTLTSQPLWYCDGFLVLGSSEGSLSLYDLSTSQSVPFYPGLTTYVRLYGPDGFGRWYLMKDESQCFVVVNLFYRDVFVRLSEDVDYRLLHQRGDSFYHVERQQPTEFSVTTYTLGRNHQIESSRFTFDITQFQESGLLCQDIEFYQIESLSPSGHILAICLHSFSDIDMQNSGLVLIDLRAQSICSFIPGPRFLDDGVYFVDDEILYCRGCRSIPNCNEMVFNLVTQTCQHFHVEDWPLNHLRLGLFARKRVDDVTTLVAYQRPQE